MKYADAFFKHKKYQSHKLEHYFPIYDELMGKFYGKNINYLEIGIAKGGSLDVAKNIFGDKSKIMGCDILNDCKKLEQENIAKVFIGSQSDDKIIDEIVDYAKEFDIILDDGSHFHNDMIQTFIKLFPYLNEGGVYMIEDTHTQHSYKHKVYYNGMDCYDYFTSLSRKFNDFYIGRYRDAVKRYRNKNFEIKEGEEEIADFTQQISSITFYEGLIAIKKNTRPKPHILKNFKE